MGKLTGNKMHDSQAQLTTHQPLIRLVTTIALSVFVAEAVAMILLSFLPPFSPLSESLLGSALLVILLFAMLYLLLFRPLVLSITERVRSEQEQAWAEEGLARAAQEWQTTFDAANDAIWILDQDQRILLSNKTAERLFQRTGSDMIGKHCWEIVHGTEQPIPECPILRARDSLCRETMELPIGESWFQVTVDPILDESNEYDSAVHIINDITERVQAEKKQEQLLAQRTAVGALALALGDAKDIEDIYHTTYENVQALMDADAFVVSFYDRETQHLHAGYAIYEGNVLGVTTFPSIPLEEEGRGTQSRVIHTGAPFYNSDYRETEKITTTQYTVQSNGTILEGSLPHNEEEETVKSALYVPMKVERETIGVMQVQSYRLDAYSQADIDVLSALANVAAVALRNARLLETLQEHREHLEEMVEERTAELRKTVNLMAGREVRMAELKDVIRELRAQLEETGLEPVADDPLLGGS